MHPRANASSPPGDARNQDFIHRPEIWMLRLLIDLVENPLAKSFLILHILFSVMAGQYISFLTAAALMSACNLNTISKCTSGTWKKLKILITKLKWKTPEMKDFPRVLKEFSRLKQFIVCSLHLSVNCNTHLTTRGLCLQKLYHTPHHIVTHCNTHLTTRGLRLQKNQLGVFSLQSLQPRK